MSGDIPEADPFSFARAGIKAVPSWDDIQAEFLAMMAAAEARAAPGIENAFRELIRSIMRAELKGALPLVYPGENLTLGPPADIRDPLAATRPAHPFEILPAAAETSVVINRLPDGKYRVVAVRDDGDEVYYPATLAGALVIADHRLRDEEPPFPLAGAST